MGKGISPLISAVILIAIAVTVAGALMSWSVMLTKSQQEKIENRTGEAVECIGADIAIDEVYLNHLSSNISRVIVRNSGFVKLTITSAVLLNKNGVNATLNTTLPVDIAKGEIKTIEFKIANIVPNCGNFSLVKVSTNCFSRTFDSSPKDC